MLALGLGQRTDGLALKRGMGGIGDLRHESLLPFAGKHAAAALGQFRLETGPQRRVGKCRGKRFLIHAHERLPGAQPFEHIRLVQGEFEIQRARRHRAVHAAAALVCRGDVRQVLERGLGCQVGMQERRDQIRPLRGCA